MGVGPTSWHTWRPPTPRSVPWSRWAAPPRCKVGPGPCLRRRQRRHWAMSTAALDQIVITTFVIRGFISLQSILLLPAAAAVVDRPRLLEFFLRMCVPPERGGGMTMHEGEGARDCVGRRCVLLLVFLCCSRNRTRGVPPPPPLPTHTPVGGAGGEVDVRGCYCALAACEMLCLDKCALAAAGGLVDYIRRCQVWRGEWVGLRETRLLPLLFTTLASALHSLVGLPACLHPRMHAELRGRHRRRAGQRGPRWLHLLWPGGGSAAGAGETHSCRGQLLCTY